MDYEVLHNFLLYRKFLKSSEIVYNGLEIKNDITKERRGLRHDVVYEVLFWFRLAALSDYGERIIMNMDLSIFHNLSILFK